MALLLLAPPYFHGLARQSQSNSDARRNAPNSPLSRWETLRNDILSNGDGPQLSSVALRGVPGFDGDRGQRSVAGVHRVA
jgi:hypothetical protein